MKAKKDNIEKTVKQLEIEIGVLKKTHRSEFNKLYRRQWEKIRDLKITYEEEKDQVRIEYSKTSDMIEDKLLKIIDKMLERVEKKTGLERLSQEYND